MVGFGLFCFFLTIRNTALVRLQGTLQIGLATTVTKPRTGYFLRSLSLPALLRTYFHSFSTRTGFLARAGAVHLKTRC